MADWLSARILLAGFILVLASLLIVLVVGNLRRDHSEVVQDIVRQGADLAMRKINYTETQGGLRKWSIQADSATHDFGNNVAAIRNIRMVIYNSEKGDLVLTAIEGKFDMERGEVDLAGDVTLEDVDGRSIQTAELKYEDEKNLLSGDSEIMINTENTTLSGVGFRYDLNRKFLKLLSSVEARFKGAVPTP